MKKFYQKKFIVTVFAIGLGLSTIAQAEETIVEKTQNVGNKVVDSVKKGTRAAKDEVCEMVNGKMECVAKKVKHKMQNAADSVGTKVKDEKNKID